MNTQHLRYALEIERTGSISQAAENLFIGQPTLSKVIKDLEESLGITIFTRTARGTIATEKGARFLNYAREVLQRVESMEALRLPDDPDRQDFCVTVPHADYIYRAAVAFAASLDPSTAIHARIIEADALKAISDVVEERSGLGIIRYATVYGAYFSDYLINHGLESEMLWEYDPLIVVSKASPLCALERVDEEALRGRVCIGTGDEDVPYLVSQPAQPGERPHTIDISTQSGRLLLASSMPDAYLWSSPVPRTCLERYALVQKRAGYPVRRWRDIIIYRPGALGGLERQFIDRLYAAKNDVAFSPELR